MSAIKQLKSLDAAIIILRTNIIAITSIPDALFLNALSVQGTDLAKVKEEAEESVQDGLKQKGADPVTQVSDLLVLFDVGSNNGSRNNMIERSVNYAAYKMHIIAYGNDAEEFMQNMSVKLLDIDNKVKLNLAGVQVSSISDVTSINEYKNETLWQRRDIDIDFAFRRWLYTLMSIKVYNLIR